jgi:hypothetical protein
LRLEGKKGTPNQRALTYVWTDYRNWQSSPPLPQPKGVPASSWPSYILLNPCLRALRWSWFVLRRTCTNNSTNDSPTGHPPGSVQICASPSLEVELTAGKSLSVQSVFYTRPPAIPCSVEPTTPPATLLPVSSRKSFLGQNLPHFSVEEALHIPALGKAFTASLQGQAAESMPGPCPWA